MQFLYRRNELVVYLVVCIVSLMCNVILITDVCMYRVSISFIM